MDVLSFRAFEALIVIIAGPIHFLWRHYDPPISAECYLMLVSIGAAAKCWWAVSIHVACPPHWLYEQYIRLWD